MMDGRTQLVGLIGWPVAHSLSPVMHNAAFDAFGLNWRYLAMPVRPGYLEAAVRGLAALGFRGANVTAPHKEAVVRVLDSVAPNVEALGAANTLVMDTHGERGVGIRGFNTDDQGFLAALRSEGLEPAEAGRAVVVGAGGGARAVVYALLCWGSKEIVVLNRTCERAQGLAHDLGRYARESACVLALPLTPETLIESARQADLLVHATVVGTWPDVDGSIWPEEVPIPSHLTVYDLVYNPLETRLLRHARRSGAQGIDGLGMLVWQGALALAQWTDCGLDVNEVAQVMRAACAKALGGNRAALSDRW